MLTVLVVWVCVLTTGVTGQPGVIRQQQGSNKDFICELDPSLSRECDHLIHEPAPDGLFWKDGYTKDPDYYDIMKMQPPTLLESYRSPCWYERISSPDVYANNTYLIRRSGPTMNGVAQKRFEYLSEKWSERLARGSSFRLRCLPYLWIIGETKCGTTDLFDKVILHPDIEPGFFKEGHWFSGWRKFGGPVRDFIDSFDIAAERVRQQVRFDSVTRTFHHNVLTIDGSAPTLWGPMQWAEQPDNEGKNVPEFINAHYIRHMIPDARFLVTVRNPTDRLYSHYLYFPRDSYTQEFFHDLVQTCISVFNECIQERSVRECLYDKTMIKKMGIEFKNGFYFQPLMDWFEVYPREKFHIVRLEDFSANRLEELNRIYQFLDLDPLTVPIETEGNINAGKAVNAGGKIDEVGPMWDSTRQILNDFFRPYNQKLAEILGDDRFLWDDHQ